MALLDDKGLGYLVGKLKDMFAPKNHTHDGRYYTESEIDGSSLSDNIILSGELSMINQGQIYVCETNKLSFTVKRRPVCDLMLYFYARQWTT